MLLKRQCPGTTLEQLRGIWNGGPGTGILSSSLRDSKVIPELRTTVLGASVPESFLLYQ